MKSLKVNCMLISTILLWASAFIGIKIGLAAYSPGSLALLRFLVASVCMAVMYGSLKSKKPMPMKDKLWLMLGGVVGIGVYNICLNFGEISVSAGIASFVIGLMPVITVLLSLVIFKERLNIGVWAGILISFIGLLFLALGEHGHTSMQVGIFLILISSIVGSILTLIQQHFGTTYHPTVVMSWVMWGGTLLLLMYLPDLWREIQVASYHATAAAIYMGVFPATLAYLAWTYVLKYLTASKASMGLNALPVASTLLGFLVLQEIPTMISMIGGSVALFGAVVALFFQKGKTPGSDMDDEVLV